MAELLAQNWLLHQLWLFAAGLLMGIVLGALWGLYRLSWSNRRAARRDYLRGDLLFALAAVAVLVIGWFGLTDGSFSVSCVLALLLGFALSRGGWERLFARIKRPQRRRASRPPRPETDAAQRLVISSARQGRTWAKAAVSWGGAHLPQRRRAEDEPGAAADDAGVDEEQNPAEK